MNAGRVKHMDLARRLYAPSAESLFSYIPEMSESLIDYFSALSADLSLENVDGLLHALSATDTAVRKLRVRLVAEQSTEHET